MTPRTRAALGIAFPQSQIWPYLDDEDPAKDAWVIVIGDAGHPIEQTWLDSHTSSETIARIAKAFNMEPAAQAH